jgi:hypothetical protein
MATVDLSNAFNNLPNVGTYSFYTRQALPYPQQYTFTGTIDAFKTIVSKDEDEPSGGFYVKYKCSFKIGILSADAIGVAPKPGDKISDSDGDWIVTSTHRGLTSIACGCLRMTVGPDQVDWRKVAQNTNVFGDRITDVTMFPLGGVFPCRVQPADNTILDQFGKRGAMQHYVVYVLTDEQFTYGDLLIQTNAANRKFVIRDWRSREDIENAMMVLCEVLP